MNDEFEMPTSRFSGSAKRNCDGASGSKELPKKAATEEEEEEQKVAECSVCLQPIDEGGEHRLVALKCGHPFGEKCVKKFVAPFASLYQFG